MRWALTKLIVLVAVVGGFVRCATAAEEVWLLSSRRVCACPAALASAGVDYWRLENQQQWIPSDAAGLYAGDDPAVPTIVYLHGNRADACDAVNMGWQLYRQLVSGAGGRSFRLLIWSWPSDRIPGVRRDVQAKAARSDCESYLLAQVLSRMNPKVRVSLIGFSFGTRVINGTLHLLGGGELNGWTLPTQPPQPARVPMRAVLLAAAEDSYWLCTGQHHGQALTQVDRMLVTYNHQDPVLHYYPLMYGCGGPQALGYVGPTCCGNLDSSKIELLNLTCEVDGVHNWDNYFFTPSVLARLSWYAGIAD